MAFGIHENPALSPSSHLDGLDYPLSREQLAQIAGDNGAPADVINLFKCLPRGEYQSKEEVLRDYAEAARRMAMGGHSKSEDGVQRDRRNIGRGDGEAPSGKPRGG